MHKSCAQTVCGLVESAGKVSGFYPTSTARTSYLKNWLTFVHNLNTSFAQTAGSFPQKNLLLGPLNFSGLYTQTTGPMNTTNLIKE